MGASNRPGRGLTTPPTRIVGTSRSSATRHANTHLCWTNPAPSSLPPTHAPPHLGWVVAGVLVRLQVDEGPLGLPQVVFLLLGIVVCRPPAPRRGKHAPQHAGAAGIGLKTPHLLHQRSTMAPQKPGAAGLGLQAAQPGRAADLQAPGSNWAAAIDRWQSSGARRPCRTLSGSGG